MRKLLPIFFIISLLLLPQARAQEVKGGKSDSDMIDIESDRMDVDTQKGVAVFSGRAKAVQKDVVIQAEVLTLVFDDATRKVSTLKAEKDVYIHWQDKEATCEKAVYRLDEESLDLTGNVLVTRGVERLSGQRVAVDLKSNRQSVEGLGGRVKIRVKNDQETGILKWEK